MISNRKTMKLVEIECEEICSPFLCDKPLVSVWCTTYNHKKYIKECFEGVLSQQVSFPYEIVVFDDASLDGTSDIIRQYCESYPELFHAFIAKKNSYHHMNRAQFDSLLPKKYLRGKYVAICEGDDYWISGKKLQTQVDYLERNPDCILTMHNAIKYNMQTGVKEQMKIEQPDRKISVEEIIMQKDGMWPTASMVGKKEVCVAEADLLDFGIWDWPMQLYAVNKGDVYYFNQSMSVYRYLVDGSWSVRTYQTFQNRINYIIGMIKLLCVYNDYTHKKYESIIYKRINKFFSCMIEVYEQPDEVFASICKAVRIEGDLDNKILQSIVMMRQRYNDEQFCNINKKILDLVSSKMNVDYVFVFSSSTAGKRVYRMLKMLNIEVYGFLDNSEKKWGSVIDNKQIYSPEIISTILDKEYIIVVATLDYDVQICEQLRRKQLNFISAEEFLNTFFYIDINLLLKNT